MPCTEPSPSCQKIAWPWATSGLGSNFMPRRKNSTGICPRKPPLGGSSCQKSPTKTTLMPPKALVRPRSPFFSVPTSLMIVLNFISSSANNFALTMLISSMNIHLHWAILLATSVCFWVAFCAAFGSAVLPKASIPQAWWMVSPSKSCAVTAWRAII